MCKMYVLILLFYICLLSQKVESQAVAETFTLPPFGGAGSINNVQQDVVVDTLNPSGLYMIGGHPVDCSDTPVQLCNQEAWTDFGLAISGIIPRNNLCQKYAPETSCVSIALSTCSQVINNMTKTMMIAFARVVVAWCYDGGTKLNALERHNECLSMAMFDAMTTQGCLFDVVAPFGISQIAQKNSEGLQLTKLLNNLVGTYQSSTIICMKKSIEEACGKEAAQLSLGPAMEEIMPPQKVINSTTEIPPNVKKTEIKKYTETIREEIRLYDVGRATNSKTLLLSDFVFILLISIIVVL